MNEDKGRNLYDRLARAHIPDALIDEAIDLAVEATADATSRAEVADRLERDEYRDVLRRHVADVVILTTAAMELPAEDVYCSMLECIDMRPEDEIAGLVKTELMRSMASAALDEVEEEQVPALQHLLNLGMSSCCSRSAELTRAA